MRIGIWLIMLAFMVLSVPWFFTGSEPSSTVLGLPDWAAYSLGVSLVNAAVAAWVISRHWDTLAGDDEDDDEEAQEEARDGAPDGEGDHGQ